MVRLPAAERRKRFLDATVEVVARHGVRGATTRQIAEQADAPLAALHYCFSSKDELLAAVYAAQTGDLIEMLPMAAARPGLAAAAVRIIETSLERSVVHRNWTLSNAELTFWAQRHTAPEGGAARAYSQYNRRVAAILATSCRAGDDTALATPLSGLVAVLVDGLNFQWFVYHDEARLRADVARTGAMIERYVAGLGTTFRAG